MRFRRFEHAFNQDFSSGGGAFPWSQQEIHEISGLNQEDIFEGTHFDPQPRVAKMSHAHFSLSISSSSAATMD